MKYDRVIAHPHERCHRRSTLHTQTLSITQALINATTDFVPDREVSTFIALEIVLSHSINYFKHICA